MSLFRTYKEKELLLGIWKVEETTEQLQELFGQQAFPEKPPSPFHEKRKREWLAVRILLKTLCGDEKEIAYRPSGKPFLSDGSYHISISHTGGYAAVALHPSREVGVDIEQYGTRIKRVVSHFMRSDEIPALWRGDDVYALLLHWSAKETLFKLLDTPESDWHLRLHVLPFVPSEEGSFEMCEYLTEQQNHYLIRYVTHPDFVLTWALK